MVPGPVGNLEARLTTPAATIAGAAVLCHPHPQYGGSMHDGVLDIAATQLLTAGHAVLRFNFRGVGASDGSYDEGQGETDDVRSILGWLQTTSGIPAGLLGYSFGAAMAWQAAAQLTGAGLPAHLVLIAPPVGMLKLDGAGPDCGVDVLHPAADDFTDLATIEDWTAQRAQCRLHAIDGANHFFAGASDALAQRMSAVIAAWEE